MEGPGKIFPGNFLLWRIPGGFEHGTVQILATSIQGEGQFCFFPTSHWTVFFGEKGGWGHSFSNFLWKWRSVLPSVWLFFSQLMITLPLSSSNGEKTTHRKDLKFLTMLNTFWRISTPTKTITQPTHWFLGGSSAARCCGEETFGVKKRQSWRDTKLGTEVAGGRTWWMAWRW